mmetsp:Transcript_66180/g.123820  ORF Transcript_66180/g.123820 Transcript_66180/m.123820 type:complete len:105 (-) Transcript_66180:242-556(-)
MISANAGVPMGRASDAKWSVFTATLKVSCDHSATSISNHIQLYLKFPNAAGHPNLALGMNGGILLSSAKKASCCQKLHSSTTTNILNSLSIQGRPKTARNWVEA